MNHGTYKLYSEEIYLKCISYTQMYANCCLKFSAYVNFNVEVL
jgi:hypothetical protein